MHNYAYLVISLISILGIKAGCVSVDSCCTAEWRIHQTRVIVEVRQRHFTSNYVLESLFFFLYITVVALLIDVLLLYA